MDEQSPHARLPGCGLAAFAMLLLCIFLVGITGASVAYYSLFSSWDSLRPTRLAYGGVVDASTLAPMRAAGLLAADEVPDAFHAESVDGYEACAISTGRLLRVTRTGAEQMPLASIQRVEATETLVTVVGERTIECRFRPDEGADRFARMLGGSALHPGAATHTL